MKMEDEASIPTNNARHRKQNKKKKTNSDNNSTHCKPLITSESNRAKLQNNRRRRKPQGQPTTESKKSDTEEGTKKNKKKKDSRTSNSNMNSTSSSLATSMKRPAHSDGNRVLKDEENGSDHEESKMKKTKMMTSNVVLLPWATDSTPIPLNTENDMLPVLIQYGKRERGMFKDQKHYRIQKVKKACHLYHIRLDQALSLRRHHMNKLNPYRGLSDLGLGSEDDVKVSSQLFEDAVEAYLKHCRVEYINEQEQFRRFRQQCKEMKREIKINSASDKSINNESIESNEKGQTGGRKKRRKKNKKIQLPPTPPTPDFLLCQTVQIQKYLQNPQSRRSTMCSSTFEINWIDAKMFYGASSIQQGTKGAVGLLLAKAKKYVKLYGPGAFVFFNGYGEELEKMLLDNGVVALDAGPLNLENVFDHQLTWCATCHGEILP